LNGSTNLDLAYTANGNISSRSDAGSYSYNATKVHAVASTTFGKSFSYDNNGNMTWSSDNGSITFYASNLPKFVYKDANNTSHFHYGPDRSRWRHTYKASGTDFDTIYVASLFERVADSGSGKVTFKNYIRAGGMMVAMRARDSWGGDNTTYLHGDHLGSVSNYTDGGGSSLVAASYDAFGGRRGSTWTGSPTAGELTTMNNLTRRGFTEHEMLDSSALVRMNGRAFNPIVGRFVSADPMQDCGLGTQGWNRYSYIGNRAMSGTDPTGFFFSFCVPNPSGYDYFQCSSGRERGYEGWQDFFDALIYPNFGPVIYEGVPEPASPQPEESPEPSILNGDCEQQLAVGLTGCGASTVTCLVACAIGCLVTGPAEPGCVSLCAGIACIGYVGTNCVRGAVIDYGFCKISENIGMIRW